MSWGTSADYSALHDAVDAAYSKGLLLVAAAGNTGNYYGTGDNVNYPAKYDTVIAVAAIDQNNRRASFSSTGPAVELSAPGVSVYSTYRGNVYSTLSGTSMATPHVSGTCALVWAENPTLTNAQLRTILQNTAMNLGTAGKDNLYGYGLVNAYAAVSTVPPPPPPPPPPTNVTVNIVNPVGSSTVKGNVMIRTSVQSTAAPISSVEYTIDSLPAKPMAYNSVSGYWEGNWDTTGVADGPHTVKVKATDTLSNSDEKTVTVTVSNTVLKAMAVSVQTNMATYSRPSIVRVTVTVKDSYGNPLQGASVTARVYSPSGSLLRTTSGTTGSSGTFLFYYSLSSWGSPPGTYSVTATASLAGYQSGSGQTTFRVY